MFGEIIGSIVDTFFPMNDKVAEADSVADPIKSHVNGFGAFLFDCVVDNPLSACIVGLYGGSWLRVAQFVEGGA